LKDLKHLQLEENARRSDNTMMKRIASNLISREIWRLFPNGVPLEFV